MHGVPHYHDSDTEGAALQLLNASYTPAAVSDAKTSPAVNAHKQNKFFSAGLGTTNMDCVRRFVGRGLLFLTCFSILACFSSNTAFLCYTLHQLS